MKSVILIGVLIVQSALADVTLIPSLPAFAEGPENPAHLEEKPEPKCDEIISRLEAYSRTVNNHHQGLLGYLDHVAETATTWQELLSPLEKKTPAEPIPEGYFGSLQTASAGIERITLFAYDNTAAYAKELDKIVMALKNCKQQ